jgi:hypothetical protein
MHGAITTTTTTTKVFIEFDIGELQEKFLCYFPLVFKKKLF